MNRLQFLKSLGIGAATTIGVSGAFANGVINSIPNEELNSIFSPDIEKEISKLREKFLEKIQNTPTIEFTRYETKTLVNVKEITKYKLLGRNFEVIESASFGARHFINDHFWNKYKKSYILPPKEDFQLAIDLIKRYIGTKNGYRQIDYLTDVIGKGYIMMGEIDKAISTFEKLTINFYQGEKRNIKNYFTMHGYKAPKKINFNQRNNQVYELARKYKIGIIEMTGSVIPTSTKFHLFEEEIEKEFRKEALQILNK